MRLSSGGDELILGWFPWWNVISGWNATKNSVLTVLPRDEISISYFVYMMSSISSVLHYVRFQDSFIEKNCFLSFKLDWDQHLLCLAIWGRLSSRDPDVNKKKIFTQGRPSSQDKTHLRFHVNGPQVYFLIRKFFQYVSLYP